MNHLTALILSCLATIARSEVTCDECVGATGKSRSIHDPRTGTEATKREVKNVDFENTKPKTVI
jgi:hypothetical protein